jgi:predicted phosphodiesterase
MRYAVVSDIHANLEAFTAVLAKIDKESVDSIVCSGDLVGYFANPNECVALIRERGIRCVAGNHDRAAVGLKAPLNFSERARRAVVWTMRQLTADNVQFLKQLRVLEAIDDRFLLVHGALHPEPNEDVYLSSPEAVRQSCEALAAHPSNANLCFFGQTHRRAAYRYSGAAPVEMTGERVQLTRDACHLVNAGSVGLPRGDDSAAAFLIFDRDADVIEFHRVPFDAARACRRAERAGLLNTDSLLRRGRNRLARSIHSAMKVVARS